MLSVLQILNFKKRKGIVEVVAVPGMLPSAAKTWDLLASVFRKGEKKTEKAQQSFLNWTSCSKLVSG